MHSRVKDTADHFIFDVYFYSKYYSEQLFNSMSVPNMARLAVAKVVARVKIFVCCIST